jgi:hypothetical protein
MFLRKIPDAGGKHESVNRLLLTMFGILRGNVHKGKPYMREVFNSIEGGSTQTSISAEPPTASVNDEVVPLDPDVLHCCKLG